MLTMRHLLLLLTVLTLSGCAASATPVPPNTGGGIASAPASLASGEVALPNPSPSHLPPDVKAACGGIGIDATLHGSASDPHLTWLVNNLGTRIEVVWQPDYRARFTPKLEVLDENDEVVLREGDHISGGCVTSDPRTLLLEWPFK
jgi:hypothetical protein